MALKPLTEKSNVPNIIKTRHNTLKIILIKRKLFYSEQKVWFSSFVCLNKLSVSNTYCIRQKIRLFLCPSFKTMALNDGLPGLCHPNASFVLLQPNIAIGMHLAFTIIGKFRFKGKFKRRKTKIEL